MKLKIDDMDHLGRGIAHDCGKVIFIPKVLTGEECDATIVKEYKNYCVAKLNKIITPSVDRIKPICPYYDICGGCNISNLSYQEQLDFKSNKVKNIFKKYLNMDINPKIIDSKETYKYRNKITYHMGNSLGLISEFDDVISVDKCLLVSDNVNNLYNEIKKCNLDKVKLITIREMDNGIVLIINGHMNIDKLKDKCLMIYINDKCVYKKDDGYIRIGDINYKVSYDAFFQINTNNICRLYDEIIRYGEFSKQDNVIDLYCGVGSISLYVANHVKHVLGIEIIPNAIEDAKYNAKINGITNASFLCGDVAKLIDDYVEANVLIVDPPRIGLDKHTIGVINDRQIRKIIYVSCNPMTLVRDLKLFTNYQLKGITVVDMFPGTHHIECVCLLCRRN